LLEPHDAIADVFESLRKLNFATIDRVDRENIPRNVPLASLSGRPRLLDEPGGTLDLR
jgi:hypothetical protein